MEAASTLPSTSKPSGADGAMVRGGFTSIIRGEVSAGWARMHHRLWYEQVKGAPSVEK